MTYSEWINLAALVAYLLANLADVVTTEAALRGGAREGNPVVAWAMEKLGRGWIVAKLAVAGAVGWYLYISGPVWALGLLAALVGWIALRNSRIGR